MIASLAFSIRTIPASSLDIKFLDTELAAIVRVPAPSILSVRLIGVGHYAGRIGGTSVVGVSGGRCVSHFVSRS